MDIENLRKLAGITSQPKTPITETVETTPARQLSEQAREALRFAGLLTEDDDVRKAEEEIARQKKSNPKAAKAWDQAEKLAKKADANKDMAKLAKKTKPEKEEDDKPAAKEEDDKDYLYKKTDDAHDGDDDEDDKPAPKAAEKKVSFSSIAKPLLAKGASTAQIKDALAAAGISVNYLHSRLHGLKKGLKECYVLVHPRASNSVICESTVSGRSTWVDSDTAGYLVFESREAAEQYAEQLKTYNGQLATVATIII